MTPWSRLEKQAFFDERAAIAEFDHRLPRVEAERLAISQLYDELRAHLPLGILQELAAADRVRHSPQLAGVLEALGLVGVRAPAWGFGHVVWGDGTYRPAGRDEQGEAAFIFPAFENGNMTDLVATRLDGKRTASRYGVTKILGFDEIEHARTSSRPVLVSDNVVRWLCSGCLGIVIVDWQRAPFDLDGTPAFLCGSDETADRLHRATADLSPLPVIGIVRKQVSNEAA